MKKKLTIAREPPLLLIKRKENQHQKPQTNKTILFYRIYKSYHYHVPQPKAKLQYSGKKVSKDLMTPSQAQSAQSATRTQLTQFFTCVDTCACVMSAL